MYLSRKITVFLFLILCDDYAINSVVSEEGSYFEMVLGGVNYSQPDDYYNSPNFYGEHQYGDLDGDGFKELFVYKSFRVSQNSYCNALIVYRGLKNGAFSQWKSMGRDGDVGASFCFGNYSKTGSLDCIGGECRVYSNNAKLFLLKFEKNDLVNIPITDTSIPYNRGVLLTGDFDGDSFTDIFSLPHALFWGNGTTNFMPLYINCFDSSFGAATTGDLNLDGADDVVFPDGNLDVKIRWGNKNRNRIFVDSTILQNPSIHTDRKIILCDLNGDKLKDLFIYSNSAAGYWINQGNKNFIFKPVTLPNSFMPKNSRVGFINKDSFCDLISWNNNQISIFLGDNEGNFYLYETMTIPYCELIVTMDLADINNDGKDDVLVYSVNNLSVTLFNRDNKPSPRPSFTPAPPCPIIYPTPTPVRPNSNSKIVYPGGSIYDAIQNNKKGNPIFIRPGEYHEFDKTLSNNPSIELDGFSANQKPLLSLNYKLFESHLIFKNLIFKPSAPYFTPLYLNNCSLIMENCSVKETERYVYLKYMFNFLGEPSLVLENCLQKQITFVQCNIEPGPLYQNILIKSCTDTIIDLRQCPMLGQERVANIRIEDSKNITIYLSLDSPYGLSQINAIRSTVIIIGGTLTGVNGSADVIGQDGEEGIKATENSVIYLNDTKVYGGKGGDGLTPGKDANPIYADDTSTVIMNTKVEQWELY